MLDAKVARAVRGRHRDRSNGFGTPGGYFESRRQDHRYRRPARPLAPRLTINASNSLIVPGQFTLVRDWKPGTAFDERRIAELLAHGTTTVLGVVDLGDRDAIEAIAKPQSLPFNWAFVGNADSLERLKSGEVVERIAIAAANGIVAVVSKGTDEELWNSHSPVRLAADQD